MHNSKGNIKNNIFTLPHYNLIDGNVEGLKENTKAELLLLIPNEPTTNETGNFVNKFLSAIEFDEKTRVAVVWSFEEMAFRQLEGLYPNLKHILCLGVVPYQLDLQMKEKLNHWYWIGPHAFLFTYGIEEMISDKKKKLTFWNSIKLLKDE